MTDLASPLHDAYPADPYERALRAQTRRLMLHEVSRSSATPLDIERFLADPDAVDLRVAARVISPALDLGCGPGRMLRAVLDVGHRALGVDVSGAAIEIAALRGLPVAHASVFDPLPDEGTWGSALLIDINIGIGGNPQRLLHRCAELVCPGGQVIIETHPDHQRDRRFDGVLRDAEGVTSAPFPWAEVGRCAANRAARAIGWRSVADWSDGGRHFSEYRTPVLRTVA